MIDLFATSCSAAEIAAAAEVMRSGRFVMGEHVAALETELAAYLGSGPVVTCASGTDALIFAIEEIIQPGDEVIVPALTFSATYEAVVAACGAPVVVDVDPHHFTLSAAGIKAAITRYTTAVVVVHLHGWPAHEITAIRTLCKETGIALIEDCAQAFGASLHGEKVGTLGDAAAFSFYPTKPLGGIGDGGAVVFKSAVRGRHVARRRNHGRDAAGRQGFIGRNSRLDEINAAVLRLRLAAYDDTIFSLDVLANRYEEKLRPISAHRSDDEAPAPYVYPIIVGRRHELIAILAMAGVKTGVHYDPPISGLPYVAADCPVADRLAERLISLPCHSAMTLRDVDLVCDEVLRWLARE